MNPHLNLFQSIGGALLALTVVVVIGWIAIARIRAWMRPSEEADEGFSLADLRRLHREGKLTDGEYERAHAAMIASVRNRPIARDLPPKKEPLARKAPRSGDQPPPPAAADRGDVSPKPPRVRGLADGRLIIRDDPPDDGCDDGRRQHPAPPSRPTDPADPRTGPDA